MLVNPTYLAFNLKKVNKVNNNKVHEIHVWNDTFSAMDRNCDEYWSVSLVDEDEEEISCIGGSKNLKKAWKLATLHAENQFVLAKEYAGENNSISNEYDPNAKNRKRARAERDRRAAKSYRKKKAAMLAAELIKTKNINSTEQVTGSTNNSEVIKEINNILPMIQYVTLLNEKFIYCGCENNSLVFSLDSSYCELLDLKKKIKKQLRKRVNHQFLEKLTINIIL